MPDEFSYVHRDQAQVGGCIMHVMHVLWLARMQKGESEEHSGMLLKKSSSTADDFCERCAAIRTCSTFNRIPSVWKQIARFCDSESVLSSLLDSWRDDTGTPLPRQVP